MNKLHLLGALSALALAHAPLANADTTATKPADAKTTTSASAEAAIPAGTRVVATDKSAIGTVVEVGEAQDGTKAVVIAIDDKRVVVAQTSLKFAGKDLVSTYTKAQLLANAE